MINYGCNSFFECDHYHNVGNCNGCDTADNTYYYKPEVLTFDTGYNCIRHSFYMQVDGRLSGIWRRSVLR